MLPPHAGEMSILEDESLFEFPEPPESIPDWADTQAKDWRGLDFFDIEVRAEALSGRRVEIMRVNLPVSVWGMQISKKGRVRLCVNSALPSLWQRFALFHELYHLLSHTGGEHFWRQTLQPLSRFEAEADLFAWSVIWPEWREGD